MKNRETSEALAAVPKKATLKSIAAHLGVSVSTVSRALKSSPDIGRETRELVKKAAQEVGYVPDLGGVKLRTGRTFNLLYIKAIHPQQDVPDGSVAAQVSAITENLAGTSYQLQLMAWDPNDEEAAPLKRAVEGRLVDGVLLDNTRPLDARVRYLLQMNVPFVTFGRTELLTEHPYVDADNEKAAFDATSHLIRQGHKRIALIGPPLIFTYALQRRRGYLRAMEQGGLDVDAALFSDEGVSARRNREVVRQMMQLAEPPTGFVSTNDSSTLGILAGLRDSGRLVGRDCDVVSRDYSQFSNYLNPPLSTCYLDIYKVAATMSEFIVRSIEGAPVTQLQRVFETEFIQR
ncbi:LacI family DNA-binding transcriptional regulator [Propionivibrio soli]|jgi:LacI family transcriptional regulator|uniref:LacI family DNA-binding transcriptional regulator n=1 Tax=Propionivibrio soli TaxID=2976531 RepID=UPI0021E99893|nr:LacI family DNA-binding transcriptional regulator [Propionivibrio soli]